MFRESSPMVRMLFVAVVLVASWGCCSSKPRNHLVLIGSGEDYQKEISVISKALKQQIVWRSLDGTTGVEVVVTLKDGQKQPFKTMNCDGKICVVPCIPTCAICSSGEINPELVPPKKGEHYEYDVKSSAPRRPTRNSS